MDQPPRRILLKITALTFALGASGCYVWKAQQQPTRKHHSSTKSIDSLLPPPAPSEKAWISSTKRPNYIFKEPAKQRISGTKNITQPVFSTRKLSGQNDLPPEPLWQASDFAPAPAPRKPPVDYPGYPPQPATDWADRVDFTSTKSGVPLIKVKPPQP